MSTSPITLDFSKAQPVAKSQPVQLDFSNAKPLHEVQPTDEQTRSRTLQNMTAAMFGQPQATPEDQAQFEAGKKSGAINAAVDTGLGAAGSFAGLSAINSALKYLGIGGKAAPEAKQVATGLFDQYGEPIMKTLEPEAKNMVNQIITHPKVQSAIKEAGMLALKGTVIGAGGKYGLKALEALLGE